MEDGWPLTIFFDIFARVIRITANTHPILWQPTKIIWRHALIWLSAMRPESAELKRFVCYTNEQCDSDFMWHSFEQREHGAHVARSSKRDSNAIPHPSKPARRVEAPPLDNQRGRGGSNTIPDPARSPAKDETSTVGSKSTTWNADGELKYSE